MISNQCLVDQLRHPFLHNLWFQPSSPNPIECAVAVAHEAQFSSPTVKSRYPIVQGNMSEIRWEISLSFSSGSTSRTAWRLPPSTGFPDRRNFDFNARIFDGSGLLSSGLSSLSRLSSQHCFHPK